MVIKGDKLKPCLVGSFQENRAIFGVIRIPIMGYTHLVDSEKAIMFVDSPSRHSFTASLPVDC